MTDELSEALNVARRAVDTGDFNGDFWNEDFRPEHLAVILNELKRLQENRASELEQCRRKAILSMALVKKLYYS